MATKKEHEDDVDRRGNYSGNEIKDHNHGHDHVRGRTTRNS